MTAPLTGRTRFGYGFGSIAAGSFNTVPGLLLLPYLTDIIGIGAAVAGFIVFLPKFWDVILNPIAGRISDRSNSPAGRRRPFLIRAGLVLAVCFAIMFAGPTGSPMLGGTFALVMFFACATAFAFYQVPYVSMAAELTPDYEERTKLMTWRVSLLAVAILASGGLAPIFVNMFGGEPSIAGYRLMGVFVAGLIAAGTIGVYLGTRGAPEYRVEAAEGSFFEQFRAVGSSADFRPLLGAFVIQAFAMGSLLAGVAYVSKDILNNPGAATFLFIAFVGPAILVTPLWEIYARSRSKRTGYMTTSLIVIVGMSMLTVVSWGPTAGVYLAAAVVGIGYAGTQSFPLAMLPDVAANDAETTGENRIGLFTGVWTAGETFGLATGPGIYALILAFGGYQSSTAGTAVVQPDSALSAMVVGFAVLPAVLFMISLVVLRGYSLDSRLAGEAAND